MPQSGWVPGELDNRTFSQRTSHPAGVAEASKVGDAATDFMPGPSLYVGDMINVEAQSPSINCKFTGAASRFLGPRQRPISVKEAPAAATVIDPIDQPNRCHRQETDGGTAPVVRRASPIAPTTIRQFI
jgi:hypothetical protein